MDLGLLSVIISSLTLLVYVVTAYFAFKAIHSAARSHSENATFEVIENLYSLFHILARYPEEEWRLSHLFCLSVPEYKKVKKDVILNLSEADYLIYYYKERNLVINILVFYEQVYFQIDNSNARDLKERKQFLDRIENYFTERLLLNPRILFYLLKYYNGLELHLETDSFDNLSTKIKNKFKNNSVNCELCVDMSGPFSKIGSLGEFVTIKSIAEMEDLILKMSSAGQEPHSAILEKPKG